LYNYGLRSIQDVAAVFPPTLLSDNIKHMSRWMAVEIVLDARVWKITEYIGAVSRIIRAFWYLSVSLCEGNLQMVPLLFSRSWFLIRLFSWRQKVQKDK